MLLDGVYNGVATVAAFVPLIVLFFLFMAMVEDSGYLSRAAFLMDALMARLGLDGRGFVMLLMGFGCNVPALMGTRVMRSRALRLLTMLVIPFSLCSARLQVFVFLDRRAVLARPRRRGAVRLYLFSFAAAILTALLFKGRFRNNEPFVLELPPYRFPTLRQIALRGWQEVRHFLRRATKFIVAGVVLVWLLTNLPAAAAPASADTLAGMIGGCSQPVLAPLGIDEQLTIALIFGFVAKEIVIGALAVIYGLRARRWRRDSRRQHGLGAGLQLHAVHADLHALPVHHRHAAQRIPQQPELRAGVARLVAGAGVAGELRVLPDGSPLGLVSCVRGPQCPVRYNRKLLHVPRRTPAPDASAHGTRQELRAPRHRGQVVPVLGVARLLPPD